MCLESYDYKIFKNPSLQLYITTTLGHTAKAVEIREPVQDRRRASCQRAASGGGLGRKVRDTNPFPVMIYNAVAEVEDIKIGVETKLK
jgi:hypothetical protein